MPRSLPAAPARAHLRLSDTPAPYRPRTWHLWAWSVGAGGAAIALNLLGAVWVIVPASFVAVLGYQTKHARLLRDYLTAALYHLDQGQYAQAEQVFDTLAQQRKARLKVIGLFGIATVTLRRGEYTRALGLFAELLRNSEKTGRNVYDMSTEYLAICYALTEEYDAADWWLAAGRTLTPVSPLASALVGAHQGQFEEVVGFGVPRVAGEGHHIFSHEIRAFHLLRAYSAHRASFDDSVDPTELDREIDHHFELARPAFAHEYDYLTQAWAELGEFIEARRWPRVGVADGATLPRATLR